MKETIKHFHLFCGIGGGALGFNRGEARVGSMEADPECLGGVDVVPAAIKDFTCLTGAKGTVLDLFDRQQYAYWHGREPGADWEEASPADILAAAGGQHPNIVFTSPPCKGFSGLLSQTKSTSLKYQALNRLTVRGIWLALEAFKDDPAEFFLLENVPRIMTRGEHLLDQIEELLRTYGYAVARTTHDCGEIGGLAQSRKRFLLVARHQEKVPPFLYEPVTHPLCPVGQVLDTLPLPGCPSAGAMHEVPNLQWRTWVRLAFVEAGKDWRCLQDLAIDNGHLRDYLIVPEAHGGYLGVRKWDQPTGTVTGRSGPTNGAHSIADPRYQGAEYSQFGVVPWSGHAPAITSQRSPGQGRFSVQDPRPAANRWPGGKYRITRFNESAGTVIAASTTGEGAFAVADPRPGMSRKPGDHYLTGGHYGVVGWHSSAGAVTAAGRHDNGPFSVADPRAEHAKLPDQTDQLVAVIRSLDGTWHRPFTTFELAALQGLVSADDILTLTGNSHMHWRERIGNMVPVPAATAIFNVMATTILLARAGETFVLGSTPIWVRPLQIAASIETGATA